MDSDTFGRHLNKARPGEARRTRREEEDNIEQGTLNIELRSEERKARSATSFL
jgi:hypothetical protein